jgi:hypothetical protein
MQRCLRIVLLLSAISAAGCGQSDNPDGDEHKWDLRPPARGALAVTADEQMRGIYAVGSRIEDRDALGGFGPCDNYPKERGGNEWGAKGDVSLMAFPKEPVAYFKDRGLALRLVNRSDDIWAFAACDSCLYIVCEAIDVDGHWRTIETAPQVCCGNSSHKVFLKPDQYWEFPARQYTGPIKTKLRYRLDPGKERLPIYSNEFDGKVAAGQFEERAR